MRWHECRERVRFNEIDSFDVMWHGHYIKYFEIGRLALSSQFSLSPDRMKELGYYAPVVDLGCRFKNPARYGDDLIVRTVVDPLEKASITFRYEILKESDRTMIAEGYTTHVPLTIDGTMIYIIPQDLDKPLQELMAYCHG